MTTALQRIRQEQEEIAGLHGEDTAAWHVTHIRWLRLQREVLAIVRGEMCEQHAFEGCQICKPKTSPLRDDVGSFTGETMSVISDADPGDENDSVPKPPEDGSREQELQLHLFSEGEHDFRQGGLDDMLTFLP